MICILFNSGSYKIIDAKQIDIGKAPNGRQTIRLVVKNVIENNGFSDIMLTHHQDGSISYLLSDTFGIEQTKPIITYIFRDMMVDWWER